MMEYPFWTVQADRIFETERYLVLLEKKKHLKQNTLKEKTWENNSRLILRCVYGTSHVLITYWELSKKGKTKATKIQVHRLI